MRIGVKSTVFGKGGFLDVDRAVFGVNGINGGQNFFSIVLYAVPVKDTFVDRYGTVIGVNCRAVSVIVLGNVVLERNAVEGCGTVIDVDRTAVAIKGRSSEDVV